MTEYITKQKALDAIEARAQEEVASANHYSLRFRGSRNQRIIDVIDAMAYTE